MLWITKCIVYTVHCTLHVIVYTKWAPRLPFEGTMIFVLIIYLHNISVLSRVYLLSDDDAVENIKALCVNEQRIVRWNGMQLRLSTPIRPSILEIQCDEIIQRGPLETTLFACVTISTAMSSQEHFILQYNKLSHTIVWAFFSRTHTYTHVPTDASVHNR